MATATAMANCERAVLERQIAIAIADRRSQSPHRQIADRQIAQIRLGAVSYLNTKPLVYGLENETALFSLRFDVPAQCAALLHEGRVDLGLIPAIEYLRGDYRIVPGVAIGSDGPIASVAVFSRVPIGDVRDPRARHQLADVGRADADPVRPALEDRAQAHPVRTRSARACCRVRMRRWSSATRRWRSTNARKDSSRPTSAASGRR